jgi:hypothetical protein
VHELSVHSPGAWTHLDTDYHGDNDLTCWSRVPSNSCPQTSGQPGMLQESSNAQVAHDSVCVYHLWYRWPKIFVSAVVISLGITAIQCNEGDIIEDIRQY